MEGFYDYGCEQAKIGQQNLAYIYIYMQPNSTGTLNATYHGRRRMEWI